MKNNYLIPIILMVFLSGCNLATNAPDTTIPAATVPNVRIGETALPPTETAQVRLVQSIDTPEPPTLVPEATAFSCAADATTARIRYDVAATVDYAAKTVAVQQQIRYRNTSGLRLVEVLMVVEPNQWDGAFILEKIVAGNTELTYKLENKGMIVTLPQPLDPDCELIIDLTFTLKLPRMGTGLSAFLGYFGYGERQLNMGYWLPVVAPIIDKQWAIHTQRGYGEQMVLEQADWDVTLTVNNASGDLKVAAPGDVVEQPAPNIWHFVFKNARDFPVSMSEFYRVKSVTTPGGVTVETYTFPDAIRSTVSGNLDGGQYALDEAGRALQQYSDLFGTYPHRRMLVVQGDFPDGMECSGMVFVSTNWFYTYEGGATNYLTVITVHEVAHQWWYARVGNDSALAPWMDEALATYSEYVYFEEYYPDLKNWWWDFRVGGYNPQGSVDSTVYEFDNARAYINAVYLRGAQMLHNLREDIGTEAFFKLLAEYARVGDGRIATPQLFWSLFTPEQLELTQGTRTQFLREPDVFAGTR